jgi:hypothetical protein
VPDWIGDCYQGLVDAIGMAYPLKLSSSGDGTISRAGHLAEPEPLFLSPGPDSGAEGRQLIE